MDTYADLVRRLCLVRLKSREDTEDIFQTVFLKYLQHTKPFANAEHEKAWFIQVTLNACRDLLRFWARRPTFPLEALAVRADEDLKQKTLDALERRQTRSAPRRRPLAVAFAALALVVLTTAGGLAYTTPAAAVSVDADASVELAVNAFGRVVGVRCYDDDAQAAAALSDALSGTDGATVTVSADSGHCERLLSDGGAAGLTCYALDPETAQAARDAGLSLGKYRAYLALSALDPTVTQDQAGEMTMGELQQCIDACQGHGYGYGQQDSEQTQTAGETTSAGQGYGGHHGQGHGYGHE